MKMLPDDIDRYNKIMQETRHTVLTPDQILVVLEWYITNALHTDNLGDFVVLQGFRTALTSAHDFDSLMHCLDWVKQ
jgi:hypothetical protein